MQEYYREKNLNCEHCGRQAQVMHHFFPKSTASALRYEEANLIPLTNGCHFAHHNGDPRIHAAVMLKRGKKWYDKLVRDKNTIVKPSISYYEEVINKYKCGKNGQL